jgi:cytosine/adenosine deaminase-related metal-dependent hydrolase
VPDPSTPTLLIRNGTVLTMDPRRRVLDPGYVAVRGADIIGVGPDADCPWQSADRVIDARGHAVLPGFVNAHAHSLDILIRGGVSDDRRLYDWLVNINLPAARVYRIEDNALAVRLWSLEALRSGITTVVDQIETPFNEWDEIADVVVGTYVETGLRAVVAQMFYDTEPPEMTTLMGAYAARHPELKQDLGAQPGRLDEMLKRIGTMITRHHGSAGGRISFWPAPGVAVLCTREALLGAQKLARDNGVMTTVHVQESPADRMQQGISSIQFLASIGYLAPDVLAAHCVQADSDDIRTLALTGTKVSSQPVSNLFLGNGIAPVADMQTAGVTVALGTDDGDCNNSVNMIADLKIAALVQKGRYRNPAVMTAERVLEMATIDGARAVGMADRIGSLEVGKRADLMLLDLTGAHMTPRQSTASAIVYQACGHEVRTVVVDGRVVLEDRQANWLSEAQEAELLDDVRTASARIIGDAGVPVRSDQEWLSVRAY